MNSNTCFQIVSLSGNCTQDYRQLLLIDKQLEFTLKFVHYTDPKFTTINELKSFVDNYERCFCGGTGPDTDIIFGQTIVPGQVVTNDLFITDQIFVCIV